MMIESLTVAQAQLGETLSEKSGYFTLHTGTTKYGDHFGTYDITAEDKTYHLGLRHIFLALPRQPLTHSLKFWMIWTQASGASLSNNIMYKIKNTMSDTHAAEKLFCNLLTDYREHLML